MCVLVRELLGFVLFLNVGSNWENVVKGPNMWECDDCKMNQEDRLLADNRSMELEARVELLEELLVEMYEDNCQSGGYDPELMARCRRVCPEGTTS